MDKGAAGWGSGGGADSAPWEARNLPSPAGTSTSLRKDTLERFLAHSSGRTPKSGFWHIPKGGFRHRPSLFRPGLGWLCCGGEMGKWRHPLLSTCGRAVLTAKGEWRAAPGATVGPGLKGHGVELTPDLLIRWSPAGHHRLGTLRMAGLAERWMASSVSTAKGTGPSSYRWHTASECWSRNSSVTIFQKGPSAWDTISGTEHAQEE